MVRDRDEWQRAWTAGSASVPQVVSPSVARVRPVLPDESVTRVPRLGGATGFDGAYDLVSDAAPQTGTYGREATPLGAPSVAPSVAPPAIAPAAGAAPGRRRSSIVGLLALGLGAGAAGALLMLAALGVAPSDVAAVVAGEQGTQLAPADTAAPAAAPSDSSTVVPGSDRVSSAAELVLPSVVRVNVSSNATPARFETLGSGVIYRADGYIITNNHVIENGVVVEVLFANGERAPAEIVGADEQNDLAVLRVDRTGLPAIRIRPADEPPRVGETVIAIGSPFGLDATVTAGIVSAINRNVGLPGSNQQIYNVVQTDAAINRGNSGGALVDLQGRLIGINTLIQTESGGSQGVGFAVSSQQVVISSDQLIEKGFFSPPLLGISGTDISAEIAAAFGLPDQRGVVVESVVPDSGAASGGLLPGDIITAVDGQRLLDMSQLVAEVRRRTPGTTVRFDVLRGGEQLSLSAILTERPAD